MKTPKNQYGFSVLALIASIVVIAGLIFGGYYVWEKNQDEENGKKNTTSQNSDKNNAEEPKGEEPDPSEGGKYLVIKEWGVRIPLSDDIKGAYYTYDDQGVAEYVSLFDAGFDGLENKYGVSCGGENKFQIYSISRATPGNVSLLEGEGGSPEYKYFPFTNKYMFGGLGAHQAAPPCATSNPGGAGPQKEDATIYEIENEKEQAFDNAFEQLETVVN